MQPGRLSRHLKFQNDTRDRGMTVRLLMQLQHWRWAHIYIKVLLIGTSWERSGG